MSDNNKPVDEIRHSAENIDTSAPDTEDGASEISTRNAENREKTAEEIAKIDTMLDLSWMGGEIVMFVLCIVLFVFAIQTYNKATYQRFYERILEHKASVTAEVTTVNSGNTVEEFKIKRLGSRRHTSYTLTLFKTDMAEIEYKIDGETYIGTLEAFSKQTFDKTPLYEKDITLPKLKEGEEIQLFYSPDDPTVVLYDKDLLIKRLKEHPKEWQLDVFLLVVPSVVVLIIAILIHRRRKREYTTSKLPAVLRF